MKFVLCCICVFMCLCICIFVFACLTHGNTIFDILEQPSLQKYAICKIIVIFGKQIAKFVKIGRKKIYLLKSLQIIKIVKLNVAVPEYRQRQLRLSSSTLSSLLSWLLSHDFQDVWKHQFKNSKRTLTSLMWPWHVMIRV